MLITPAGNDDTIRTPPNDDLLRRYILDQRRRGLAEATTITSSGNILRALADRLGPKGLLAATPEDIQRFLDTRKVSPASRAGYLSRIRAFYTWAVAVGHLDRDPTATIVRPKVRPGLPRPIPDNDLALVLELSGGQHRVMLALAAFEGFRCVEIARLVREDIFEDRDPAVIIARGKDNKPRPVPLHPETWKALSFLPLPRAGPVLRRGDGVAYQPWEISHIGNSFLHGLGLDSTMHALRHWFGTEVYRSSGHNLLLTSELMGHANVETTRVYAAYDRAGAVDAVSALRVRGGEISGPVT